MYYDEILLFKIGQLCQHKSPSSVKYETRGLFEINTILLQGVGCGESRDLAICCASSL